MQELIDYIGQSHYLPGDEALNCDESEARVKAHLTCLHTRMPFDRGTTSQANDKAMLVNGYLRPARLVKHILNLFSRCRLPYRKPCRWKRYNDSGHIRCGRSSSGRLQVNFRTEDSEIPDTEPFILEGLSRYQINQQLLNALVEQDDAERRSAASGRQGIYRMALLVKFSGKHSARSKSSLPTESLPVASRGRVWKLISPATVCR